MVIMNCGNITNTDLNAKEEKRKQPTSLYIPVSKINHKSQENPNVQLSPSCNN